MVATATTAPYQANVTVPVGATSLTLGAAAGDLGGNTGTAAEVVVSVIPDPKTTAAGRVVDKGGTPVAGATVACLEVSGLSGAAGTFALPEVPTTQSALRCTATVVPPDGRTLTGSSVGVPPVRGGRTDMGTSWSARVPG